MKFNDWWKQTFPEGTAWTVAEAAWNAALEEAASAAMSFDGGNENPDPQAVANAIRRLKGLNSI